MSAAPAGCAHPHSIEQGRKDFKIYMSKLLERSANLDSFRSSAQLRQQSGEASATHESPAWGPSVGLREDHSSPAGGVSADATAEAPLSPSYFRDKQHWPRAGTATPPRTRAPPNFSWEHRSPSAPRPPAPGPTVSQQPPSQTRHTRDDDVDIGQALIESEKGMGESVGTPPAASVTSGARHTVLGYGAAEAEEYETRKEGNGGDSGGWKATWAKRLAWGPIYTEYRDRFSWPQNHLYYPANPEGVGEATVSADGVVAGVPFRSLAQSRRPQTSGPGGVVTGRAREGAQGGDHSERSGDFGFPWNVGGPAKVANNTVEYSTSRLHYPVPNERSGPQLGGLSDAPLPPPPPQPRRLRTACVSDTPGDALFESPRGQSDRVAWSVRHEPDGEAVKSDYEVEKYRYLLQRRQKQEQRQRQPQQQRRVNGTRQEPGEDKGPHVGEADVLGQQSRVAEAGSSSPEIGTATVRPLNDDREPRGIRRVASGEGQGVAASEMEPNRRETSSTVGREGCDKEGIDAESVGEDLTGQNVGWRTDTAGRSVDVAVDPSSQSIMTEYMDEFEWPAELPKPGHRGKRTGMGMDHVGRLLAGQRAEERPRAPDPGLLARLGGAADRALNSASPTHLAEMCKLRSPSPTARRLVLGLVVALGLRWRRWADIRTHVLGNKADLRGFLLRFDKDRVGLSSGALMSFAEDPNLSPVQVKQVAVCMLWLSRYLRALYDYLSVKEGKIEVPPARAPPGSMVIRHKRHSHRKAHKPLLAHPTAQQKTRDAAEAAKPGAKERGTGEKENTDLDAAAAAALARADLTPTANIRSSQQRQEQHQAGNQESVSASSQALATRGPESSVPEFSMATAGGGGTKGGVSFAGSAADVGSESAWTAGTVTSRGDVLEAPTEEQIDAGSLDKEDVGIGATAVLDTERGRTRAAAAAAVAAKEAGTEMTKGHGASDRRRTLQSRSSSASNLVSSSQQTSDGCVYTHKHKARTPSRFANPKARRPSIGRHNPILANQRWPPPVEVKPRERTEQRSAFSLEHSFIAGVR